MKTTRQLCTVLFVLFSGFTIGTGAVAQESSPAACDRSCLRGFIDQYLLALSQNNPDALGLAPNIRFTEDNEELSLSEGLWQTATAGDWERLDILDVHEGVAATLAIVEDRLGGETAPVMLSLRLKIVEAGISEIEMMVVRDGEEGFVFRPEGTQIPNRGMLETPPAAYLMPREEMIRVAEHYPEGLIIGSFVENDTPFAPDAYRIENGALAAGPGPGECMEHHGLSAEGCRKIKTQRIIEHPDLTYRVAAVDEEEGIVLLHLDFGDTGHYGPGKALNVWEAFKVYDGQIHAVEAYMKIMPSNTTPDRR